MYTRRCIRRKEGTLQHLQRINIYGQPHHRRELYRPPEGGEEPVEVGAAYRLQEQPVAVAPSTLELGVSVSTTPVAVAGPLLVTVTG